MEIRNIKTNKKQYQRLLLLADEQEDMIDRYLQRGVMYVLEDDGVKAECVVTDEGNGILELKNIKKPDQVRRFLSDLVEQRRSETGVKGREIYGSGSVLHSAACDTDGDGIPDCDET